MKDTLYAIYENGVFRPLRKLAIPEGRKIRLTVEMQKEDETYPSSGSITVSAQTESEGKDAFPPLHESA